MSINQSSLCPIHTDRLSCLICLDVNCSQESRIICMKCAIRGHKHLDHAEKVYLLSDLLDLEQLTNCVLEKKGDHQNNGDGNGITQSQLDIIFEKMIEEFTNIARQCKKMLIESLQQSDNNCTDEQIQQIQNFQKHLKQYEQNTIDHSTLNEITKLFVYSTQLQEEQAMEVENLAHANQKKDTKEIDSIPQKIKQCVSCLESISKETNQIYSDLCKKLSEISLDKEEQQNHKQAIQDVKQKLKAINFPKFEPLNSTKQKQYFLIQHITVLTELKKESKSNQY